LDIEAEIRELKRRVGELEGAFTFLTQQVRAVHADLLEFRKDTVERLDRIEHALGALRSDLPHIIAGAVGAAFRFHRG
jgi:gamma-glutamylcyclotransferase (GGCT)/AIG2-like uncharacterized protein YtfP